MGALYLVKESAGEKWLLDLAASHGFSPTMLNSIQYLTMTSEVMGRYKDQNPIRWFPISKLTFSHSA